MAVIIVPAGLVAGGSETTLPTILPRSLSVRHCPRCASHILEQTGSYEQAIHYIQDTPTWSHHYGRFLPQDKAALAAKILNRVWEAAWSVEVIPSL